MGHSLTCDGENRVIGSICLSSRRTRISSLVDKPHFHYMFDYLINDIAKDHVGLEETLLDILSPFTLSIPVPS